MCATSAPQGRAARSLASAESRALARARRRYRAIDRRVGLGRRTADRGCSRRAHLRARPRSSSSSVMPSACRSSRGKRKSRAPLSLARNRAIPQRFGASVSATGSHANLGSRTAPPWPRCPRSPRPRPPRPSVSGAIPPRRLGRQRTPLRRDEGRRSTTLRGCVSVTKDGGGDGGEEEPGDPGERFEHGRYGRAAEAEGA